MRLVLHPKVYSDIDEIMGHYERIATPELSREFYAELRHYMRQAAERPESFPIRERDLRRVNLQRFPYHFLFRIVGDVVRILVVRHHRRRPTVGIRRR
jgi:plasmid stabilization system protein ParE